MGVPATGAGSELLVGLEKRCPDSSTGIPLTLVTAVAPPAAPTTSGPSGAGVTGTVQHRVKGIILGRGKTAGSAASTELTVSNKTVGVSWSALGSGTGCIGYVVERASISKAEDHSAVVGLEDATFAGTFAGEPGDVWEVEITANGTPDVFRWRKNGGSWTTGVNITGSAQTLSSGVTVTFGATTGHTIADKWTYTVSGTWRFIAYVYGRTTVTYSDSTAVGSENTVISASGGDETATNWGLVEAKSNPMEPPARAEDVIRSNELSASLGRAQSIAGMLSFPAAQDCDLRIGTIVPYLASFSGKPTTSVYSGSAIQRCVFAPTDAAASRVSLWSLSALGGGAFKPYLRMGSVYNELDISGLGGNNLANFKAKGMSRGDSQFGPLMPDGGNTGTYPYAPVLKGTLNRTAYDLYSSLTAEITSAPAQIGATAYGSFAVKLYPPAGDGTAVTIYYRMSDGHVVMYGAAEDHFYPMLDASGYPLGIDSTNNAREPLVLGFPGDVTGLLVGDKFTGYQPVPIPGTAGAAPTYTEEAIRYVTLEAFGAANVKLYRGASTATDYLATTSTSVKLARALFQSHYTGGFARLPGAVRPTGAISVEIDVDRDFDASTFEDLKRYREALVMQLVVEGARIATQPGTFSAYRESFTLDAYRLVIDSITKSVTEANVAEKLKFTAERLDDPNAAHYQITTISAQSWDFSLAATA